MTASQIEVPRETVLAAVKGLRVADPTTSSAEALEEALGDIIDRSCDLSGGTITTYTAYPAAAGDAADGVLIDVSIQAPGSDTTRSCAVLAVVTTDPALVLTGSAQIAGRPVDAEGGTTTLRSADLSGDVWVTGPVDTSDVGVLTVTATGSVLGVTDAGAPVTPPQTPAPEVTPPAGTPQQTLQPRTDAEKQAARAVYDQRVAALKRAYARAVKKARGSKRKKRTAKAAYTRKKAAAKATYLAAIADRLVTTSPAPAPTPTPVPVSDGKAFTLSISTDFAV